MPAVAGWAPPPARSPDALAAPSRRRNIRRVISTIPATAAIASTISTMMPRLWMNPDGMKSNSASVEPSVGPWTEYMNPASTAISAVMKMPAKIRELPRNRASRVRS